MSYTYPFPDKICNKPSALHEYINANIDWSVHFFGLSTGPLLIYADIQLTEIQLSNLTTIVNNYTDPAVYLAFDHVDTLTLNSKFNDDNDNVIIDNKNVIQTFIYSTQNISTPTVLDGLKTVIEYNCPNVQNYVNTTSGNISIEIYDITRNTSISSKTVDLNEIAQSWNTLAQTGSTQGSTIYRTILFTGLINKSPNYDVVLQLRGSTSDSNSKFRCNSLQYLYYNVE
jgi:hypothetical protein